MFSIMGAVVRPGQYQMLESITLVTAIAGAGGLDQAKAGDKATIQRSFGLQSNQVRPATARDDRGGKVGPRPSRSTSI